MKYVRYDDNGKIVTFYTPEIHKDIPANTIEITDEQWQDCLCNQNRRKVDIATKTIIECEPEIDIEKLKAAKKELLNKQCQESITSGFYSSALGESHKYESKIEDQINLMGAVQMGVDMLYRCWNTEGTKQEWFMHTADQLKQVSIDGSTMVRANLEKVSTLKEQVEAAETLEEIEAIVW